MDNDMFADNKPLPTEEEAKELVRKGKELLKDLPPWHRVVLGWVDGQWDWVVARIYPNPMFGEHTDGTLFTEEGHDGQS